MGYMTELNTLLKLPESFDTTTLAVGTTATVTKDTERVFPLHVALLLVGHDWTFYGYAVVHGLTAKDKKTTLAFEVLSLFTPQEQGIYKQKFLEAAQKTGEV